MAIPIYLNIIKYEVQQNIFVLLLEVTFRPFALS